MPFVDEESDQKIDYFIAVINNISKVPNV